MRYPNYDAGRFPPPDISLVEAYMTLIGRDERDHSDEIRKLPKGSTRRASMQIGRACLLGKRDATKSRDLARNAFTDLDPKDPQAGLRRIHTYRTVARMIERRDDPLAVLNLRRNLHRQAIEGVEESAEVKKAYRGVFTPEIHEIVKTFAGKQSEDRISGILNRKLHPWFMAVVALEHHDISRLGNGRGTSIREAAAHNFDLALVESFPSASQADSAETSIALHRLQIKRDCFGFCQRDPGLAEHNQDIFETEIRPSYASNITLLSGCCDIELSDPRAFRQVDWLLADEFRGDLGDEGALALEGLTDHVLHVVRNSEELGRRGTFDVETLAYA